jgi:flagellar hook-associated protein 2
MSSLTTSGVTVGNLDSFFVGLINDIMTVEQQPLTDLKTKQDQISVKKGAFSDLSSRLSDLQMATWAIQNTNTTSLILGNKATVTGAPSGSTVLTAAASSDAVAGQYNISLINSSGSAGVLHLATEHRVRSVQQTYVDQALALDGTFYLGGQAARSTTNDGIKTTNIAESGFGTADVVSGQTELGSDTYKVETRVDPNNSAWYQFRLVDSDGNAVNVQQGTTGVYSNGWQAIPTLGGTYDTGRGLTVNFAADGYTPASGSSADATTYTAQGAKIVVAATDSLNDIANKINGATYGDGHAVSATVVDRQLILSAKSTGLDHRLIASDDPAGTNQVLQQLGVLGTVQQPDGTYFAHKMQDAQDAVFMVNGLQVSRSSNTNLTDVISGVSLSLTADAAEKSAMIDVTTDTSNAREALDTFITSFNTLTSYLQDRMAITSQTTDGVTTYTRGVLNGESAFDDLRQNLYSAFMNDSANSGTLTNLRQLGLSLDNNLKLVVSDSAKLENALTTNFDNAKKLLDAVAGKVDVQVGRFTGKTSGQALGTGYLTALQTSLDSENSEVGNSIISLTAQLTNRQQSLVNQFGEMQAQLYLMQYQQQQWQSIYSAYSASA